MKKPREILGAPAPAFPPVSAGSVSIRQVPTGVRGLDDILGGGFPEYSFNIIAGPPGSGKTTLAHQIVFANATRLRPALYFTVLGEPAIKMMRYQQQYSFFDPAKMGRAIRFINLSDVVANKNLAAVLAKIGEEVAAINPGIVVLDSFRTVLRNPGRRDGDPTQMPFLQNLALLLTSYQATAFLIGEYSGAEMRDDPLFTVADGLIWLSQITERNSVVRKLQIMKLRGQESMPGLHTIRINSAGLQAFSRTLGLVRVEKAARPLRLSTGIPHLDKLMGGGVFKGDSLLVAGPSGTGKTVLATQFIAAGIRRGETGVIAIFEERPARYLARATALGLGLKTAEKAGKLEILYLRPVDLSVDETMQEIMDAVKRTGATRLAIDSLAGLEMALAPGFRADFRESLYRMIVALTGAGITILSTVETEDSFGAFQFSHYAISFLTDDIIRLRYIEVDGQLRKILTVVKMRGGNHSKDIREYIINDRGVLIVSPRRTEYAALTTGLPGRIGDRKEGAPEPRATT